MEIAQGVYAVGHSLDPKPSVAGYLSGYVSAFLLDDGNGLTLIDTLWETDARLVLRQLERLGRPATHIRDILLSHGHRSHLGGLAALKTLSGATVYSHEYEADIIAGEREPQRVSPIPKGPALVYPFQLALAVGRGAGHPPCPVDRSLGHGDRVGPIEVVHSPGHSPGHLAFYWQERGVLFAGDAVATWPNLGPGWPGLNVNTKQEGRSLHQLAELDPQVIAVGHGSAIRRGAAARLQQLARSYR